MLPEINNTERLRTWLLECPSIQAAAYFGADYLGENATEYSILSVPSLLRYRENIIGKRVLLENQEQNFIFAAKIPYGSDVQQNLANLKFFQDVANWINTQSLAGNLPEWDGGTVTSVSVSNTGAPIQIGSDAARYQFQIKVTYKIH